MQKNLKQYKNVEIIPCGMWSQKEELRFSKNGNAGSRITVHGATKIYVDSIDHMHAKVRVTLIKMDIEGMEMQALEGAKEIIMTQKPKLAICVYHLIRDIWQIQEKLMQFVPEYQFCLEQPVHVSMSETVLYAFVGGQSES